MNIDNWKAAGLIDDTIEDQKGLADELTRVFKYIRNTENEISSVHAGVALPMAVRVWKKTGDGIVIDRILSLFDAHYDESAQTRSHDAEAEAVALACKEYIQS